ncbi:carboxylic ester hydrolase [Streptomyces spiroverticillatus]|uniref:Carboxylic ester hydrolase n=1 Tax=Streptomyces finlayi TaxID=67296 RepID=A0A919CD57_9ACTN|nr:carboxylesterase family protein [Streptomyces finlayi]GHA28563.1 carboxylic ester hydrolase [Streptomyces spiroverticillatus]GHD09238.1 carboxylic ester hydrolase [Streptomyces finlayi]
MTDATPGPKRLRTHCAGLGLAALVASAAALLPSSAQAAPHAEGPVARTASGAVRGETTREGQQFLGVPYAAQPVGALRWKAPQAAPKWQGVREATRFANKCVQTASWDPGYENPSYTEDCLALNVYAPKQAASQHGKGLPVMVWFHGGGLTAGAGQDVVPDEFARRTGTVVVAVNYRLGAMGFLSAPGLDAEAKDGTSGNFGMQDQQAALRWVRANIGGFGGDPAAVTIAGESAGGLSVCTQLASPTARGLFRAGIIESGAYNDCAARTKKTAAEQGTAFAAKLGCTNAKTAVACLRGKSSREILAAQSGFSWSPVVGGSFLPVQPTAAFKEGKAARVPVLNGANKDEGRLFAFGMFDGQGKPLTPEAYPLAVKAFFGPLGDKVLARYPAAAYSSPTIAIGTAIGDQMFACSALRLDRAMATHNTVYTYEFADRTSPPFASSSPRPDDFDFGAMHVNEIQYLFKHFGLTSPFNAEQRRLSDQMVQYWGSFVRGGVPRAAGQPAMPAENRTPGTVLSLKTASAGGNTLDGKVGSDHQCDLWDAAATA